MDCKIDTFLMHFVRRYYLSLGVFQYRVSARKKETRFISEYIFIAPHIETNYMLHIKSIFSSIIWYQTHNDISMYEWKGTI